MANETGEDLTDTEARRGLDTAPPKVRSKAFVPVIVIGVVVVVALVTTGIVALGSVVRDGGQGGGLFANPWSGYPGTRYIDSREILASPSREEVAADVDGFIAEFRERIGERYDVVWIVQYEYGEEMARADNGYDGESMLYDYNPVEWTGAAVGDDPEAREFALDLFEELAEKYGLVDFFFDNEDYADDDDVTEELRWYGAETFDEQAKWAASAYNFQVDISPSFRMEVFDASMPVDETFDGWNGVSRVELESGAANLFLTISGRATDLLAEDDRDEFIERLRAYDENDKP